MFRWERSSRRRRRASNARVSCPRPRIVRAQQCDLPELCFACRFGAHLELDELALVHSRQLADPVKTDRSAGAGDLVRRRAAAAGPVASERESTSAERAPTRSVRLAQCLMTSALSEFTTGAFASRIGTIDITPTKNSARQRLGRTDSAAHGGD